jgi:hypothetical protein
MRAIDDKALAAFADSLMRQFPPGELFLTLIATMGESNATLVSSALVEVAYRLGLDQHDAAGQARWDGLKQRRDEVV